MANRTETATLIMALRDEMSGNAGKVVTSLDKVKGAEKALGKQSDLLNESTKKLVEFGRLDKRLESLTAKLAAERGEMKDLSAAILASDKPTKAMETRYRALEKGVGVLTGQIGKQKDAVEAARAAFERLGGPLDSMASAEARVRARLDETTDAIRRQMTASVEARQAEERSTKRREALKDLRSNLGMFAGPAVLHEADEGVKSGATVQSERVRIVQLGTAVTPDQGKEIEARALDLATKYKTITQAEFMHMVRNAVTTVGGVDEALSIADPLGKLRVIADAQHPGQSSGEEFDQLIKGMEIGGVTRDPKKFESYMNGIAKGLNAFGDTVKPGQYYEMFKYGRGATPRLSEDFMLSIAPSLGQELGGSSFGKAVSAFEQTVVTGRMKKQAGQTFASLGLIDPKDLQEGKGGEVSVRKGASIKGWQEAQSDPFAWVKDVLLPHLEAAGIKDPEGQSRAIAQMFGDATAQQLVSIMATQTGRIEKDRGIVQGAHGLDSYQDYLANDPFVALRGLGTSLETFTGVLTSPGMGHAAQALDVLSSGLAGLSKAYGEFAAANPKTAELIGDASAAAALGIGGKLTYNLGAGILKTITGGGGDAALAGSATALDGSAIALDKSALAIEAAAGRLGMAGVVPEVAKDGAPAAAAVTTGGIIARALPPIALTVAAIEAGKYDAGVKADTAKTWNTPQAQALPDMDKQSWSDFMRGRLPDAAPVPSAVTPAAPDATSKPPGAPNPTAETPDSYWAKKKAYLNALPPHADGGIIRGPGGPRSDKIGIRVSSGEAVIPADVVRKHLPVVQDLIGRRYADGGIIGSPAGLVTAMPSDSSTSRAILIDAVAEGTFRGLDRLIGVKGEDVFGGGSGDIGGSSIRYGRDSGGHYRTGDRGGAPNMRYGRSAGGGYRNTPSAEGGGPVPTGAHDPLKDLIAQHETGGTGAAGYDTAYGHAEQPGSKLHALAPPKPLTQMTIAEVLAYQREMKPRAGSPAFPVGRVQWTESTLRGLTRGMDPNTVFSPDVQEKLFDRSIAGRMGQGPAGFRSEWDSFRSLSDAQINDAIAGHRRAMEAVRPAVGAVDPASVATDTPEVAAARRYLEQTAQGAAVQRRDSISKLNPAFALKAAEAIRRARAEGINAGIFSGYRRPSQTGSSYDAQGYSGHSYGIASDFSGIGMSGSATSRRFDEITRALGLGGYGPDNPREFNHKELFPNHLERDPERLARLRATLGPNGEMVDPAKTWSAAGVPVPKLIAPLPKVAAPAPVPLEQRTLKSYMFGGQTDDERRAAERAVLPRRPPATVPAEVPERHAMEGGVDFEHGGVLQAIEHVRTLKAELASLKGVHIPVKVGGHPAPEMAPGAVRTALNNNFASDGRWS